MSEVKSNPPETSECDKLAACSKEYNAIMEFLDWTKNSGKFHTYGQNMQSLLYEYFGIDARKLEKERRALLEWTRKCNEMNSKGE